MIANIDEYKKALEDIQYLENWISDLNQKHPDGAKGLTKAGIRGMIARIQLELGEYEGKQPLPRESQRKSA